MTRIVLLTTAIVTGLVVAGSDTAAAFGGRPGPADRPSFSQLDADGNGKLTLVELQAYPAARAAAQFTAADTDGDGKITREELAVVIEKTRQTRNPNRVDVMIARFDTDKDGAVSQAEMDAMIGQGRQAAAPGERMLRFADTDRDGAISESEYTAMVERVQQRLGRFAGKSGNFGPRGGQAPFWRN